MSGDWLEIPDGAIDTQAVVRRVLERVARHSRDVQCGRLDELVATVDAIWTEVIAEPTSAREEDSEVLVNLDDCDVVPRHYTIGWRAPIVGPIHAIVRRIIYAEVRRYLGPALERQSTMNRQLLQAVRSLTQQNARLREEIQSLREQAADS